MEKQFDFSGWATKNDLRCSDGRTIRKDAFKHNDGETVPLVWNHQHNDPLNVLGHALLENRDEGVYAYCTFNETEAGQNARLLVEHGDVSALSIYANQLKQNGSDVLHGAIREVSLVLAGANPGAFIDSIIAHGEESEEEAIIYTGEEIDIYHADSSSKEEPNKTDDMTALDILDELKLNEEQKTVVLALIGEALAENPDEYEEVEEVEEVETNGGDEKMKHNVFEEHEETNAISHSDMNAIFADAKRYGSLKDSALAHGIEQIDYMFPEAQNATSAPEFIAREMGWVQKVIGSVHHTPFSRIKSLFANITEEDARAKGYIKGKEKKDEVFSMLKRTTAPTTIYKKQKLDRDDMLDITDFDVVAWLKSEMRMMLDEEIARAILIGDGRLSSSDDKINEQNIRPIAFDDALYTIQAKVKVASNATSSEKAREFIRTAIKARKDYKGSGAPVLFTTEDVLTDCLLMEDGVGRVIYDTTEKLANALRVKEIVTVPVMEGVKGKGNGDLMGVIVNLRDYNVGADKGGSVNMFDDFDIDINAQKYLIETRCSGALIKPYSAIALEVEVAAG